MTRVIGIVEPSFDTFPVKILRISLAVFSALLLGAHFLRSGSLFVVLIVAATPLLLLSRSLWAVRSLQMFLLFGALEWARTCLVLYQARVAMGEPWLRLVLILVAVAATSAFSGVLLEKEVEARRRQRAD